MSSRKKILVLSMSCNQDFFVKQDEFIKTYAYGKSIMNGDYPDMEYYSYSASIDDNIHINRKTHKISVPCDDSLFGTYEKTRKVLEVIDRIGIEYDYVFRTNTSTYVNLKALDKFVNGIPASDANTIFSASVYSTNASGPELYDFYGVGNSLLIPKFWCDVIKNTPIESIKKFDRSEDVLNKKDNKSIYGIDDNAIGFVCNVYCEQNGIDKYSIWGSYGDLAIIPFGNVIKEKMYDNYISCAVRVYGGNRNDEFGIHKYMLDNHDNVDISVYSDEQFYKMHRELEVFRLIDFINNKSISLNREDIMYFVNNKEEFKNNIYKFLEFIRTNKK